MSNDVLFVQFRHRLKFRHDHSGGNEISPALNRD